MLVQIQVNETRCAVIQNHIQQDQGFLVAAAIRRGAKRQLHLLFARILNSTTLCSLQSRFLPGTYFGHRFGFPLAKFFCNQGNGLIGVYVTTNEDAHIVGHVIGVEIILNVDQGWVLEMIDGTDSWLLSIGMNLVKQLI